MKTWINTLVAGLVAGLILPLVVLYIISAFAGGSDNTTWDFIKEAIARKVHTHIISLGAIPNLLLFFIFIWTDRLKAARGVLLATFILAFSVLIIKLTS